MEQEKTTTENQTNFTYWRSVRVAQMAAVKPTREMLLPCGVLRDCTIQGDEREYRSKKEKSTGLVKFDRSYVIHWVATKLKPLATTTNRDYLIGLIKEALSEEDIADG